MKKRWFIFLCIAFCLSTQAYAVDFKPSVDGFKEWKIGSKYVNASDEARKHVQDHPFYKSLPQDFTEGSLYWRERLQLKIDGRLDKNLYVRYDVEEETDMPSKHDIYVKFYNHEFTFGDFEQEIRGGPFASLTKKLNGFMYNDTEDSFSVFAALGEERSDTDLFVLNGNGSSKSFRLRYNPIVEGSLKVFVNDARLTEGRDYSINYSDYTVTMQDTYGVKDTIKFIYDYTNPVEDFIMLDRQQFKAARVSFMMDAQTESIRKEDKITETIDLKAKYKRNAARKQEQLTEQLLLKPLAQMPMVTLASQPQTFSPEAISTSAVDSISLMTGESSRPTFSALSDAAVSADNKAIISHEWVYRSRYFDRIVTDSNVVTHSREVTHELIYRPVSTSGDLDSASPITPDIIAVSTDVMASVNSFEDDLVLDFTDTQQDDNTFILRRRFLLSNSEIIEINGKKVAPRDYYVNYADGIVKLSPKVWTQGDLLKISYSCNAYATGNEVFSGVGTIGPYMLNHRDVIKGNISIYVNRHRQRYDEDYRVNWEKGEITFRRPLLQTDVVRVVYLYYLRVLPPLKKQTYNWFSGGMTYLQKRAKSKDSTITTGVDNETPVRTQRNVNVANYLTGFWPIKEDTLRLMINGQVVSLNTVSINYDNGMVTIDYNVADYINSTASLSSIDIDNAVLKFSYSYYQPKGPLTYQFSGASQSEPWNSPFDNKTGVKFISSVANYIKMDRKGDQILVRLRRGSGFFENLNPGKDYEIEYEQDASGRYAGQIGVIIYKPYTSDSDRLFYGYDLKSDDVVEVKYNYVISDQADPGYFQHDVVAMDGHFNLNDRLKVNVDAAYSAKEYERGIESNTLGASINATGVYNQIYQLPNQDIVKGTEYFTFRGIKRGDLEPGRDYYINYAKGELKFIGLAPTQEDQVMVFYDYYTNNATLSKTKKLDTGLAARIDSSYKDDRLEVGGEYISIDRNFQPYTGSKALSIPVGSTQWAANTRYKVMDNNEVYMESRQTKTQTDLQGDAPVYLVTDYAKYGAIISPQDWITIDGYQNNMNEVSDRLLAPAITQNTRTVDNRTTERGVKVVAGPDTFLTKVNIKDVKKEWDYLDKYQPYTDRSKLWELTNYYAPFSYLSFSSQYGYSDVYTTDDTLGEFSHSDRRRYYGSTIKSNWLSSIFIDGSFKITDVDVVPSYNPSGEVVSTNRDMYFLKDASYALRYEPNWNVDALKNLELRYQLDHSEADGIALAQKGKISNNKTYGARVVPYGIRTSYQGSAADSVESDGNKKRDNLANTFQINSYSPISWFSVNSITLRNSQASFTDLIPQSASQNFGFTKSNGINYNLAFTPFPSIRYSHNYALEDYQDINTMLKATSSNITLTQRPKNTIRQEVAYALPEVNLSALIGSAGIPFTLGLSDLQWLLERSKDQTNTHKQEYPTQDMTVTPSLSFSSTIIKRTEQKYTYNANPLKWLKSTYLSDQIDNFGVTMKTLDTNDTVSNTDLLRKFNVQVPIWSNLSFETAWTGEIRHEWENVGTTHNISETGILADYSAMRTIDKAEYLLGAKWAGFLFGDWKLNGLFSAANQTEFNTITPSLSTTIAYKIYTLSPGLVLYGDKVMYTYFAINPGRLELSYQHYFDFIYQQGLPTSKGFRSTFSIDWIPFQTTSIKGTASYKRNAVWGDNTNEAQQQKDVVAGSNAGTTQISRQNYADQEGKLDLEILVPISGLMVREVINNIKINLSAILVESKDHIQPNSDKNYYLWSLLGKFAINF